MAKHLGAILATSASVRKRPLAELFGCRLHLLLPLTKHRRRPPEICTEANLAPDLLLAVTPRFLRRDPNPIWTIRGTVGRHRDYRDVLSCSQIKIEWRDELLDGKGNTLHAGNDVDRFPAASTERSSLPWSKNLGNRPRGCRPVRRALAPGRVVQLRPTGSWAAAFPSANHGSDSLAHPRLCSQRFGGQVSEER